MNRDAHLDNHDSKKKMCDIARLAGVSSATVSRALNESPLVSEKTRKRIEELARQHHYVINRQAQNLRRQSSKTISLMVPIGSIPGQHVSDPFFLEIIGIIADALTEANYELLLSRVSAVNWSNQVLSHNYVDGIIVIGQDTIHQQLNDISVRGIAPTVVWGAHMSDQRYITIGSDNTFGGRLAAEHFLKKQRKNILFIGDTGVPEVDQRYRGFCEALAEQGIEHRDSLKFHSPLTQSSGTQAMNQVLQKNINFDAVFAASDVLASCAVRSLRNAGINVPTQVSVIGYDDIAIASHMSPAITTISQKITMGGKTLVDLLLKQIAGEQVSSKVITPVLIERET